MTATRGAPYGRTGSILDCQVGGVFLTAGSLGALSSIKMPNIPAPGDIEADLLDEYELNGQQTSGWNLVRAAMLAQALWLLPESIWQ
jgi:hypothetical protein